MLKAIAGWILRILFSAFPVRAGANSGTGPLKMVTALLILSTILPSPGGAKFLDSNETVRIYQALNKKIIGGFISPQAANEIAQLFDNQAIPAAERPARAFAIYLDQRLALEPENIQARVRSVLQERVERKYFSKLNRNGNMSCYFIFEETKIYINLPEKYRGSLFEYASLAHETEHLIQALNLLRRRSPDIGGAGVQEIALVQREAGAMVAEFEYLRHVPAHHRLTVQDMDNSTVFYDFEIEYFNHLMTLDASSPAEWVRKEHMLGRYGKSAEKDWSQRLGTFIDLHAKQILLGAGAVAATGGYALCELLLRGF